MHIHRPAYAYAYFKPVCAYKSMHMQTRLNPNPKTNKQKSRAEMKTLIIVAKHAQNIQENITYSKQTCYNTNKARRTD